MSKIWLGIVLSIALLTGYAYAQATQYELSWVLETDEAVAKCGAANGRAALVADLDAGGILASEWVPYCLTESK